MWDWIRFFIGSILDEWKANAKRWESKRIKIKSSSQKKMIKRHKNKFPDETEMKLFFEKYVLLAEFFKKKLKM